MKRSIVLPLAVILCSAITLLSLTLASPVAEAQNPNPPNDRVHGLVFDGLQPDASKPGLYKVNLLGKAPGSAIYTHGPDAVPANLSVARSTVPVVTSHAPSTASAILCDGDGVTGNRVQVLYAHASGVADRYATYLASFQQWVVGMDAIYDESAAQTGGTRHIRFVTDASCNLSIPDVTLSPTGGDTFANTISDLQAQGYNRNDRKYIIFMDAHVYCGISSIQNDDRAVSTNANNGGNSFGRIDSGCWTDLIPAHELMHTLGGVQLSAPHSDGNWHCTDSFDNLCDHTSHFSTNLMACPQYIGGLPMDSLLDCNHDDYYSTNPPAGSYLATHWNTAFNQFLIVPSISRVDSIATGKQSGSTFSPTTTFSRGDTVVAQIHVVDGNGANQSGATVDFTINQPSGTPQCSLSTTSNTNGVAQGSCLVPSSATVGTWNVHVVSATKSPASLSANSVTVSSFSVQYVPTAVHLSSFGARSRAPISDLPLDQTLELAGAMGLLTLAGALKLAPMRRH